jgi:PKD repeat protein
MTITHKKALFAALGILLAVSPALASADTVTNLQSRIQALLAQLHTLQLRMENMSSPSSTPAGPRPAEGSSVSGTMGNRICLPILRQLVRGSSGSDVTNLQDFLRQEGVFTGDSTGFFGAQTEAALEKWQAREGIVASGDARTTGFGAVGPRTRLVIKNRCGQNDALVASPRQGSAPLTVTFNAKTASINSGISYVLNFGDGTSQPISSNGCNDPAAGACAESTGITHTYTTNGTYTAKLTETNPSGSKDIGTANIFVGPITASTSPKITGVTAPSALRAGQTGTWRVVTALATGDTTFSVVWGDENVVDQIAGLAGLSPSSVQHSDTFTHAYAAPGDYSPRFTATNAVGSTSVVVPIHVGEKNNAGDGFTASPRTGSAPLNVAFSATGLSTSAKYSVSFGDGSDTRSLSVIVPPCASNADCSNAASGNLRHTYTAAGSYTATLYKDTCPTGAQCFVGPLPVGTATITVSSASSGTICTMDAMRCPDGTYVGRSGPSCAFDCSAHQ